MAVEACSSPNLKDDMDEDDEEPLVFKRSGSSSRQSHSQFSTDKKKLSLSSQKSGMQPASARQMSDARPANGESSHSQNGRIGVQSKASPAKSPLSSAKETASSAKGLSINSSTTNSKPSGPSTDKAKQLNPLKSSNSVKEAKPSVQSAAEPKSAKESASSAKGLSINSSTTNSKPSGPTTDKAKQLNPLKSSNSVKEAKPSVQSAAEPKSAKESASSAKGLLKNSSTTNSKPSGPSTDKGKQLNPLKSSNSVKEAKPSVQSAVEPKSDYEDPDDEKPLRSRAPVGLSRGNYSHSNKKADASNSGQQPGIKQEDDSDDEDPDDEKPLRSRAPVGLSRGNYSHSNKKADESNSGQQPGIKQEDDSDDEDPDDEKPLRSRVPVGLSRGNYSHSNKKAEESNSGPQPSMKQEDESDDEKPLSHRLLDKSNNVESKCEPEDSDDDKPLSAKRVQNGSAPRDCPVNKSSTLSSKRPPGVVKSSTQPPVKKAKLSVACTPSDGKKAPPVKAETKTEDDDDDDDDDDDIPLSQKIKKSPSSVSASSSSVKKVTKVVSSSLRKTNVKSKKINKNSNYSKSSKMSPSSGEGKKWTTLIHNGVIFPPPYKPHGVKMLYKKQPVDLTPEQEEVATMIAVMLDTDYMNKPRFKENFFNDWKKILGKNHVIQKFEECDFTPIYEWHQREKEKKKQMTTDEKKALKEEKLKQEEKYMWAIVDGTKEKVGNFRVEPPGLFRGRGEHPRMGKLKKRIRPSDIVINIGKNAPVPECPIPGERWKEIRHDNTVTWLAYWNDPINQKEFKYVFLAASSTLKGQSDKEKYEKARKLKDYIQDIRKAYTKDFTSKDSTKKQIAVATYLIDKLALRAGNEKDDDEADTVGCCTLKVENVEPVPPNTLKFDFLGKDSIRYQNEVNVERPVFEAIQQFRKGKKGSDDLFDELDTAKLNAHLKELMPCLTAKVFRTYNASITLDDMLSKDTRGADVAEKVGVYQHANKEVAIICNHQRTVSKTHSAQMLRLDEKIGELKAVVEELEDDLSRVKKGRPPSKSADGKPKRNLNPEALERKIAQTNAKIEKMERDKDSKEDLKTVALGTSKINYLDPRITVAWCKRHEVPIEKMFNKSLLAKFAWAMDVDPSFRF